MTACLFLLLFSASEYVLDSTRYDPEYFPFNGFVSILQIFAGLSVLGLTIYFSIRAIRRRGFRWYLIPIWLGVVASMTGCGVLEYLVQRYSDRHTQIYTWMSISAVGMVIFPYMLYTLGRKLKVTAPALSVAELPIVEKVVRRKRKRISITRLDDTALEAFDEEALEILMD